MGPALEPRSPATLTKTRFLAVDPAHRALELELVGRRA